MKLRSQFFVFLAAPTLLVLAATLVYDKRATTAEVREARTAELGLLAGHAAGALDARLGEAVRTATALKALIEEDPAASDAAIYAGLRRGVEASAFVQGASLAFAPGSHPRRGRFAPSVRQGADGLVEEDTGEATYDHAQPRWGWWKSPEAGRRPFWSGPFAADDGQVRLVSYALPFHRQGIFAGVVLVDLALPALTDGLCGGVPSLDLHTPGGSLCDAGDGGEALAPAAPGVLQRLPAAADRPALWRVSAALAPERWRLTAALPEAVALAPADARTQRLAIALGLALLALAAGIWLLSGRMLRAVARLDEAIQAVGGGNYATDLECGELDELGDLTRSLSNMTVQVASREGELRLAPRTRDYRGP